MSGDKYFKSGTKFHERVANFTKRVPKPLVGRQFLHKRGPEFYRVTKVSGFHNLAPGLHLARRGPAWSVICTLGEQGDQRWVCSPSLTLYVT